MLAALPSFDLRAPAGFDYLACSDLPVGSGLSSSAAIELASALAFLALTRQEVSSETLAKVGRHGENHFVGVPCGILDQGVSAFGLANHLVHIDCARLQFGRVPLPSQVEFWVFNTHTKHALVDGLYAERHRECQEAAAALGVTQLADLTIGRLEAAATRLPPHTLGRARHVVTEIARVESAVAALRAGDLPALGRLLTASHRSSQHLFGNSTPELDFLVDQLEGRPQVHGARLTGGGFGGAVMALTSAEFSAADAGRIADAYAHTHGARPDLLHARTGPGADLV